MDGGEEDSGRVQTTWSLELRKPALELRDSLSLPFLLLWEPDVKKSACACHTKCDTQEVKNPQEKRDHEIMLSVGFCWFVSILLCFTSISWSPMAIQVVHRCHGPR